MSTSNTGAPWIPYIIPPCPIVPPDKTYALSFTDDAVPTVNPSQFLIWKDVGLPKGLNLGDILYWDPNAGENNEGAWVILPPPSGGQLHVLASNGQAPFWNQTVDCE